ncbi:hypothetical protein QBC46DRAFT_356387 [Diplogelasinospora grovesii]|uniref:Uncharacterized protein n=1 Tax=Diplogelasinospora grovesii TaxID=303347 RepID=A0AAN6S2S7_9PEZI|nr:hypothetical protein QBC46DRAFT_356387 [Diplogelasinospora grovesii]
MSLFAVLFAAAAAATPSSISQAQASVGNCTTNSFTVPSWYVREFHSASGAVTLDLQNRASNSTASLTCQTGNATSTWSKCASKENTASLDASVQLSGGAAAAAGVQVRQTWVCDDRNTTKPIAFTASGNASLSLTCASNTCTSTDPLVLVRGTLHSPVENVSPAYASGPDGHDKPGCGARSKDPTWELGTIVYLNETGDGSSAIASQSIQFQVVNTAIGYTAGCLNYFAVAPGEDPAVRMVCGGGVDFTRRERYSIRTETVFYPRSRQFGINQTWFCDDADAARPVMISATGNTTLSLDCTTDGTSTACQADKAMVRGSVLSEEPLPAYSIEDPLPTPDGCTISSIVAPSWTQSNFEVDKNATATSAGESPASVSFNMKLKTQANLFDYPVFVNQDNVLLEDAGEKWWPCSFGAGEEPSAPKQCSFRYSEKDARLELKADWVCFDLDANHPIMFSGVTATTLPKLNCATSSSTALSRCATDPDSTWQSDMANVTWRTVTSL